MELEEAEAIGAALHWVALVVVLVLLGLGIGILL